MSKWIKRSIIGWNLSLFDGILTFVLIQLGLATESNPFMAELISISWILFFIYKILILGLFLWVGRLANTKILAQMGIIGAMGSYGLIIFYELKHLIPFLFNSGRF